MTGRSLVINIDGASRGNPGPAAYGIVLRLDGQPLLEIGERIPPTTNNIAEYTALLRALEVAQALRPARIHIRSDSELLVRQMTGVYKVKNPQIQELYAQAKQRMQHLGTVTFEHVYREDNQDADRLCNEALDGHPSPAPDLAQLAQAYPPTPAPEATPPATPPPNIKKKPAKRAGTRAVTTPRIECTIVGDMHAGPDQTMFLVSQGVWFELVWPEEVTPNLNPDEHVGQRFQVIGRAAAGAGKPWLLLAVESWKMLPADATGLSETELFP